MAEPTVEDGARNPGVMGTLGQWSEADLAALRKSLRCGSSTPTVMHLTELEEVLRQRRHVREPIVLCSASNADHGIDLEALEESDCPGCVDCWRYCPDCVAEALRLQQSAAKADRDRAESTATKQPDSEPQC